MNTNATPVSVSIGTMSEYSILLIWGAYVLLSDGSTRWLRDEGGADCIDRQTAVDFARRYAAQNGLECSV